MTIQKSLSTRAWLELLALGMIWGASFMAIRVALDEVTFLWTVVHRVGWAALILWAVVHLQGIALPRNPGTWGAFLVMGCLNNVIPFSLMAWGQLHIESGLTSILNASTAVFGVIVAAMIFPDERLTLRRGAGVVIGFLGVATAIGLGALLDLDLRSLAQLAVLAGAVSYAIASAWARTTLSGLQPTLAAAGMLTGSTLIALPLAWFFEGPPDLTLAPRTILAIAYYSVMATAVAYLLFYRVLAMAGAGNLLLCTLIIPPIAIVLGAVILGETLEMRALLGLVILALGLLILDGRILRTGNKPPAKTG